MHGQANHTALKGKAMTSTPASGAYLESYTAGEAARKSGVPWLDAYALADCASDPEAFLDGWQDTGEE